MHVDETAREGGDAGGLAEARRLYERGLYLQAWRAARPAGPLPDWQGLDGRILAAQLAFQLGNQPLATRLHLRLRRLHPESEQAFCWAVRAVRARRGPYAALELLRRGGPDPEPGAELLALQASTLGMMKDFLEAERLLERAAALDPSDAWVQMERSQVLRDADDYAGALQAADESLRLRPDYRPALEARADLLVLLEREDEAMALLAGAVSRFESAGIAWALLGLQEERGDVEGAEAALARIEELTPLRTRGYVKYLARRRSDLAWLRGDRQATVRLARASTAGR